MCVCVCTEVVVGRATALVVVVPDPSFQRRRRRHEGGRKERRQRRRGWTYFRRGRSEAPPGGLPGFGLIPKWPARKERKRKKGERKRERERERKEKCYALLSHSLLCGELLS